MYDKIFDDDPIFEAQELKICVFAPVSRPSVIFQKRRAQRFLHLPPNFQFLLYTIKSLQADIYRYSNKIININYQGPLIFLLTLTKKK